MSAEGTYFSKCTRNPCQNYSVGNIFVFFPPGSKRNTCGHFMPHSATVTMPTSCMIYWLSRNNGVISIKIPSINPARTPTMWYFDLIYLGVQFFSAWNHHKTRKLPCTRCWNFTSFRKFWITAWACRIHFVSQGHRHA